MAKEPGSTQRAGKARECSVRGCDDSCIPGFAYCAHHATPEELRVVRMLCPTEVRCWIRPSQVGGYYLWKVTWPNGGSVSGPADDYAAACAAINAELLALAPKESPDG